MKERWRWIKGYGGRYQISDIGRIKSFNTSHTGLIRKTYKIMRPTKGQGYHHIILSLNGQHKEFKIARLVAGHFIPNPLNKSEVNHLDGVHNNNYFTNLEWVTASENRKHARDVLCVQYGAIGEKHYKAKLREKQVNKIKNLHKQGLRPTKISQLFHVSTGCINGIINGHNWKHLL